MGEITQAQHGFRESARPARRSQALLTVAALLAVNALIFTPRIAQATTNLSGGQWLYPGQSLIAANSSTEVTMQTDGNLVVYTIGCDRRWLWQSGTAGHSVQGVIMQTDGNLVIYNTSGQWIWQSGTVNHPGAYLTMQTDGNLVIYGPGALWSTNTFDGPISDCSYYVNTTNTQTLNTLGCNLGSQDQTFGTNSLAVLDFGGQSSNNSGTILPISNISVSYATVENLAEQFAAGYFGCTGLDTTSVLLLGVGTNNSASQVNSTGGSTWSSVVSTIRNWLSVNGFASQVNVWGANDMELSWNTQANTLNWVNAYSTGSFLDFGDAQSCPSCINGWTSYGVWWKSWGDTAAYPLPEIYFQHQANEWTSISQYSSGTQGTTMVFEGPMDEWHRDSTSFPADQAWLALRNGLRNAGLDSNMTYSTSILTAA